jgi:hypothetical protein
MNMCDIATAFLLLLTVVAGAQTVPLQHSQWVYPDRSGKLIYQQVKTGDRILDFSYAGYGGGGVALPMFSVRKTVIPLGGSRRPYHLLFYKCEDLVVRNISMLDGAYHSIRVIQSKRVHMDSIYIHNRVNGNNDGFHFISAEYVTVNNCIVLSQDDACAMFGSCKFFTITNSTFSTRWSVFRFGGGSAENITVSNCLLYEVYGCPIKFHGAPGTHFENMSFSNLVLRDVTAPIHVSLGPNARRIKNPNGSSTVASPLEPESATPGIAPSVFRNIGFSNIRGTVTTDPPQLVEASVTSQYNLGERHSCIVLSAVGGRRD